LYTVGEISAVNAASDAYAMGGEPRVALALASARASDGRAGEADLLQLLAGARGAFERMGVSLAGGHSLSLDDTLIGFAVLGQVPRSAMMTKGGARADDLLVLTKPLGTGVIMAATRAGECPASWTEGALASMRQANGLAARAFRQAGVKTCTDVSGFGLSGHLGEMLRASDASAELWLDAVPALSGALELLGTGWRSSADESLRAAGSIRLGASIRAGDVRLALLRDPQTSGGLLGSVAPQAWAELAASLANAGIDARCIGVVRTGDAGMMDVRSHRDSDGD
jgi:selenide,water dikinase